MWGQGMNEKDVGNGFDQSTYYACMEFSTNKNEQKDSYKTSFSCDFS